MNPYEVILACQKTQGTKAKKQILADNKSDILKKVLSYALDPYVTYGVKKYDFSEPIGHEEGFEYNINHMYALLLALQARRLTGNAAHNEILNVSAHLNEQQQYVLTRILEKDLRCGLAVKSVNAVFPGLIPMFEVQLAHPINWDKVEYPCLVEKKLDGLRCFAFVVNREVSYYSRNGKVFENFGCFDKELVVISGGKNMVFDGEVIGDSGNSFKGVTTKVRKKGGVDSSELRYHVFDVLSLVDFRKQKCTVTQIDRTNELKEMFSVAEDRETANVKLVMGKVCSDEKGIQAYYEACVAKGLEGVIVKNLKAPYQYKRTYDWGKIKPTDTLDLVIKKCVEGKGKYEGMLGALVVDNDGTEVNVGGGFSDEQRAVFWKNRKKMAGKIIEVKYDSVTEGGSLRFPRFVRERTDKE